MSESEELAKFLPPAKAEEDPTDQEIRVETPLDYRPDLASLGILEHERGICEDSYENRSILRRAKLNWDAVYDQSGRPTGLIAARSQESSKERRLLSLAEKKPVLTDPKNPNSDYLTGLDLLIDEEACRIIPPWVVGATKVWQAEQENGGPKSDKKAPAALPHRCRIVKDDGVRCMLWASGRIKDDGLCRIHLRTQRKPGEDVERARLKLIQSAPYAVDKLEELMEHAESEPVALKAATEILDRAGVRGGSELLVDVEVNDARPAHVIVAERLQRLAAGASNVLQSLEPPTDITDAEIVEDSTNTEQKISVSEPDQETTEGGQG